MDVGRQARRNLGGLDPARVKEILELARVPIEAEVSRYRVALRRCSAIDADDLRALGQIAALEAAQTHDPSRGSALRSWIGFLVRQRITEAMKDAGDCATLEIALGSASDVERALTGFGLESRTETVQNRLPPAGNATRAFSAHVYGSVDVVSYDPQEAYELQNARAWVERSLAGLSPRQKILVAQLLGNACESYRELAATLGVDKSRVFQDYQVAVMVLQIRVYRPARVKLRELLDRLEEPPRRLVHKEIQQCA